MYSLFLIAFVVELRVEVLVSGKSACPHEIHRGETCIRTHLWIIRHLIRWKLCICIIFMLIFNRIVWFELITFSLDCIFWIQTFLLLLFCPSALKAKSISYCTANFLALIPKLFSIPFLLLLANLYQKELWSIHIWIMHYSYPTRLPFCDSLLPI